MSRHEYFRLLRKIGFTPIEAFAYIRGRHPDYRF